MVASIDSSSSFFSSSTLAVAAAALTTTLLIGGAAALGLGKAKAKAARTETESYTLWGKTVNLAIPKTNFPTQKELEEIDEPMMPGCEHGWFESNGVSLHYRKFVPPPPPGGGSEPDVRGILVFQHGIQAHSGNALRLVSNGRKLGLSILQQYCETNRFCLYALDMYGHGFSEGTRMYIPSWQHNRDDLMNFCEMAVSEQQQQHNNNNGTIPLFVMGHSYGACLTLHAGYAFQQQQQQESAASKALAGIIVVAPAIVGDIPPPPVVYLLRRVLAPRYPRWVPFFMPNPVSGDRIWRDPEVYRLNTLPSKEKWGIDCSGQPFCLQTGVGLLEALEAVREVTVPSLNVPFCAIHGTNDYAVLVEGTQYLEEHAKTDPEDRVIRYLDGGYHDILADPVAEQMIETMDGFIKSRMTKLKLGGN